MTNVMVVSNLMSTWSDGPAVSLNGSLTMSPVTAAFEARRDKVLAEHAPTEVPTVWGFLAMPTEQTAWSRAASS